MIKKPKKNKKLIKVHGINFIREGKCLRCGRCCVQEQCSHYALVRGKPTCLIYKKRNKFCQEHNGTHEVCIRTPDHPFLKVIRSGKCGYKFKPLTKEDNKKFKELLKRWQS